MDDETSRRELAVRRSSRVSLTVSEQNVLSGKLVHYCKSLLTSQAQPRLDADPGGY